MRTFIILSLCILQISCLSRREQPSPPAVLAVVNGAFLKEDNLRFRINLEKKQFDETRLKDDRFSIGLKRKILNRMIENRLILNWGGKNGVALTEEEKTEGIARLKRGYTEREFDLMLEELSIPPLKWMDMAYESLLIDKIIDGAVTKKTSLSQREIEVYYREHPDEFKVGERVRARHIVIDSLEKARRLQELVLKGENFAKVAMMHSLSPDRSMGGDLGYFERGTHPLEFDQTLFHMEAGQISPIVKSPYGYHLFKLIDKKPAGIPALEEVAPRIHAELLKKKMAQSYETWLEELKSASSIEIKEKALKKMEI